MVCIQAGCGGRVVDGAPVALCGAHLGLVADWLAGEDGVLDSLPSPCRACGSQLGVRLPSGWVCAVCEWRHGELGDAELAPPRVDVVYYIRVDDRLKIGTTGNPRQRLGALWHQEVLAFERGTRTLERRRHEQFALERFDRTEWFALSERLRRHTEALGAGTVDPWELHARWRSEAWAAR